MRRNSPRPALLMPWSCDALVAAIRHRDQAGERAELSAIRKRARPEQLRAIERGTRLARRRASDSSCRATAGDAVRAVRDRVGRAPPASAASRASIVCRCAHSRRSRSRNAAGNGRPSPVVHAIELLGEPAASAGTGSPCVASKPWMRLRTRVRSLTNRRRSRASIAAPLRPPASARAPHSTPSPFAAAPTAAAAPAACRASSRSVFACRAPPLHFNTRGIDHHVGDARAPSSQRCSHCDLLGNECSVTVDAADWVTLSGIQRSI